MPHKRCVQWLGLLLLIGGSIVLHPAWSQQPAGGRAGAGAAQAEGNDRVVIQREAMRLIDPKQYQVALTLEPVRHVALASPIDGRIRSIVKTTGDEIASGTVAIRLEDTAQVLLSEQAEANLRVAEIEVRRAMKQGDTDLVELAEARRDAAKAASELAKFRLDQTNIRVPFEGQVFRLHVIEGQVVRAGDRLAEFGDPSQLRVEIPVDRQTIEAKQKITLTVENSTVEGTVENLLPLNEKFAPLRELVQSPASATVLIDNSSGKLRPGQLVDVPVIPRHYVAQIPNRSLSNATDGGRKVQVVRSGVIRDVPVGLLRPVGTDLSYVTGTFAPGDELIVSASQTLPDGTQVRPAAAAGAPPDRPETAGRRPASARPGAPPSARPSRSGF